MEYSTPPIASVANSAALEARRKLYQNDENENLEEANSNSISNNYQIQIQKSSTQSIAGSTSESTNLTTTLTTVTRPNTNIENTNQNSFDNKNSNNNRYDSVKGDYTNYPNYTESGSVQDIHNKINQVKESNKTALKLALQAKLNAKGSLKSVLSNNNNSSRNDNNKLSLIQRTRSADQHLKSDVSSKNFVDSQNLNDSLGSKNHSFHHNPFRESHQQAITVSDRISNLQKMNTKSSTNTNSNSRPNSSGTEGNNNEEFMEIIPTKPPKDFYSSGDDEDQEKLSHQVNFNRSKSAMTKNTVSAFGLPANPNRARERSKSKSKTNSRSNSSSYNRARQRSQSNPKLQVINSKSSEFAVTNNHINGNSLSLTASGHFSDKESVVSTKSTELLNDLNLLTYLPENLGPNNKNINNYFDWSISQVSDWLKFINLTNYVEAFAENEIDGSHLDELDRGALADLGVKKLGHKLTYERELKKVRRIFE